jgi:hypothetical protein
LAYKSGGEGPALFDVSLELAEHFVSTDFEGFGLSEIWLMDDGPKYTSRRDSRAPTDFYSFAPADKIWERQRKRRPYWGVVRDFLTS